LSVDEPTAPRLLTIHNMHWTLELVRRVRRAIADDSLAALRAELAEHWPDRVILGGRDGESPGGTG
jgi:tRNA-guanine family transglycosylase